MIRKILGGALVLVIAFGGAKWIGEDGNGAKLGRTGGEIGNVGVDAVGGAGDAATGFVDGLTSGK